MEIVMRRWSLKDRDRRLTQRHTRFSNCSPMLRPRYLKQLCNSFGSSLVLKLYLGTFRVTLTTLCVSRREILHVQSLLQFGHHVSSSSWSNIRLLTRAWIPLISENRAASPSRYLSPPVLRQNIVDQAPLSSQSANQVLDLLWIHQDDRNLYKSIPMKARAQAQALVPASHSSISTHVLQISTSHSGLECLCPTL